MCVKGIKRESQTTDRQIDKYREKSVMERKNHKENVIKGKRDFLKNVEFRKRDKSKNFC